MQKIKTPVCPFNDTDVMNQFHLEGKEISKNYQKAVNLWINLDFPKKDVVFEVFSE